MSLFDQVLKRPRNYSLLSQKEQWEIDKQLGILNWDGSCDHSKTVCYECQYAYINRKEI